VEEAVAVRVSGETVEPVGAGSTRDETAETEGMLMVVVVTLSQRNRIPEFSMVGTPETSSVSPVLPGMVLAA
jgi:hypothetical protein